MVARLATALAAVALTLAHGTAAAREVDIGVFAWQGERAAVADWAPVHDYLNQALPQHRFRLRHLDAASLRDELAADRLDFAITSPGYYVTLEAQFGLSRIATLVSPDAASPARAIGSAVIVRADRADLAGLESLAGRRLAAVAPDAFGGWLAAARELARLGIDPEHDLGQVRFLGLPMTGIVEAVAAGQVDAGVVRTCTLEQLVAQGALRAGEWRVLSPRTEPGFRCATSTQLYPDWPIAVTRRTDDELGRAVALALLRMADAGQAIGWAVPADYRPVHELYQELHAGPYAHLRDFTPASLLRRHWPGLAGALAALAAVIVHSLRVETLVQRRTEQLRESLAARQLAETRMRDSQEQMEHLSRLSVLGELSGHLAHEINQPLTTIGTYARSLLRRQAQGQLAPAALAEACNEIANEADRAGGIVQRIRHFARKRPAVREPVDLAAIARDARELLRGVLAHTPPIEIRERGGPGTGVEGDGRQIQQVLLNLLKNAIDASRDLPPQRQAIEVVVQPQPLRVTVQVVDRGCGLDEAQRGRLFEPYFTTKPDGLGLGLPICKTIVEAHGGRLWAEPNREGPGMCFSFSLPRHDI